MRIKRRERGERERGREKERETYRQIERQRERDKVTMFVCERPTHIIHNCSKRTEPSIFRIESKQLIISI